MTGPAESGAIGTIAVVGLGLMGSGIAETAAAAGFRTIVREVTQPLLDRGLGAIRGGFDRAVAKGRMTGDDRDRALALVRPTLRFEDLADADLVIEAITENRGEKRNLFTVLDTTVKEAAIFASNTSSLSITDLAAATKRPDRFLGLHFFNPVPVMKLVEIVRALDTSESTLARAREVVDRMGKTPVVTPDRPGFVVNLLLVPFLLDAVRAFESGVARREEIDSAMKLGCGHPMGPLELLDFVGLDTTLSIAEIMFNEFRDARYAAPPLLRRLVASGRLGRKNGRGFYDYGGATTAPPGGKAAAPGR